MVALTGRWWLEVRKPRKETVAAHLVNLAWNGLSHLEAKPDVADPPAAVIRHSRRSMPATPQLVGGV